MMIGRKLGMSQKFMDNGNHVPVTVLHIEDHYVVGKKENKLILGTFVTTEKHVNKPQRVFFKKHNLPMLRMVKEFPCAHTDKYEIGQIIGVESFKEILEQNGIAFVDVTAKTIGRGFAGTIKRHNFGSLRQTHGTSTCHRSHGSTGNRQDPGRVFKNKKMAGHYGFEQCTVQNLGIVDVCTENKVIVVKGAVPGPKGGVVVIKHAVKKNMKKGG